MKSLKKALLTIAMCSVISSNATAQIAANWMQGNWGVSFRIPVGDEALDGLHIESGWTSQVQNYDVDASVDRIKELNGVSWVMINLTNGAFGDRFSAPLEFVESVNPLSTPTRDLFNELLSAYQAQGIKVIAYVATQGPAMLKHGAEKALDYDPTIPNCKAKRPIDTDLNTQVYCSASMNRWRDKVLTLYTGTETLYRKFEMAMADHIVGPLSQRYGSEIDGWWFDHADFGDVPRLRAAAIQGNSNAIFAFNKGQKVPLTNNNPGIEDYTFGHPNPVAQVVPQSDLNLPMVTSIENAGPIFYGPSNEASLGHIFMPMQEVWNGGNVVFSEAKASDWHQRVLNAGGAITWSIAQEGDYSQGEDRILATPQFEILKRIQNNLNLEKLVALESAADSGIIVSGATFVDDPTRGKVANFTNQNDEIIIEAYSGVLGTQARTVSGWLKTSDDKGDIIEWGTATTDQRWWLRLVNGKLKLILHDSNVIGTTVINDNNWHHFAVVAPTGNVADIKFYIDGQLETVNSNGWTFDTVVNTNVIIGGELIGNIDNIHIHNRALSADEINYYNTPSSDLDLELALLLKFDEPSTATLVEDNSVYARHGLVSGVTLGENDATRGTVARFFGSDNVIMTTNDADPAVATGYNGVPGEEPRTVMAWVKTSALDGIIAQWGNWEATDGEQFIVRIKDGKPRLSITGGTVTGTTIVNDGAWHHIAIVAPDNDLNNILIYVDGVLNTASIKGSTLQFSTRTNNSTYDEETQVVTLNSRDVLIGNNYIGLLDDLIIHQKALSVSEITAIADL